MDECADLVLPVKLEPGGYFRLGINSTSYMNFRSSDGVAVPPAAIYFSTKGTTEAVERKAGSHFQDRCRRTATATSIPRPTC